MSVGKNGWRDDGDSQYNTINGKWFGFRFGKYSYSNGKLHYISLLINDKIFGWYESFDSDANIIFDWSGFYISDKKI